MGPTSPDPSLCSGGILELQSNGLSRPGTNNDMLGTRVARVSLRSVRHTRLSASRRLLLPLPSCQQQRQCASCPPPGESRLPKPPADHRDLAVQQELFTTSIYSPGSPIFLPAGARIFNRLVEFLRRKYVKYGFQEVITPTIYKKALWAKSGHLENYADDMFTVTSTSPSQRDTTTAAAGEEGVAAEEGDEYGLKPMNCPGHCIIFAARRHSYRDLPIRYADFSPLHRNEVSGALSGLTRVRRFHQDDGHIFCRPSQIEDEIRRTLDFVRETYETFNLGPYRLVLSTRPQEHYIGTLEEWDQAEGALKSALDHTGQAWTLNEGDGAFYGPKIDIILKDSDGKEHQTATVQLDFQLPKRFELEYEAPAPELEQMGLTASGPAEQAVVGRVRPVMIHRAVLGSVERLMALLIEHYNGKWPFWLNPRQVAIITVNDTEPVVNMARDTMDVLLGTGNSRSEPLVDGEAAPASVSHPSQLAVDLDDSPRSVGLKVREAKAKGYGTIVVIGPKNVESGSVSANVSGIPSLKDQKNDVPMTVTELLRFLRLQVDTYE